MIGVQAAQAAANAAIAALFPRVKLVAPPAADADRFRCGAVVTIRTRDGRSHTSTVHAPRGAAFRGIAWADVEAKYRTLAPLGGMSAQRVESTWAAIRRLPESAAIDALTRGLRGGDYRP